MASNRKISYEEYLIWMNRNLKIRNLGAYQIHYERELESIKDRFSNSIFWKTLESQFQEFYDQYLIEEKQLLFSDRLYKPIILTKSFSSLIEKTYRKNVIFNKNWPNQPPEGWITPENWFSRINDLVRTKIVVNYLEGMNFISSKIKEHCEEHGISFSPKPDARMEGYYAINSYFENLEFTINEQKTGNEITIRIAIELQITTQIQDLMRGLLHKEYVKARLKKDSSLDWVWKYKDDKFSTAYLAHLLHYAEGMIMQIIEKKRELED